MPLYKIETSENALQPFRATGLGERHTESSLEDWLEKNPAVLLDEEPLLIIGRQVSSPIGIIDLLALDSSGFGVVIELKRAPSQREAVGQSIEYASWLSTVPSLDLETIAQSYLRKNSSFQSLSDAWEDAYGTEYKPELCNAGQRVFVVTEGENDRMSSLVRYLRSNGLDISLFQYEYYRSDMGEELLNIRLTIGDKQAPSKETSMPSEAKLVDEWSANISRNYEVFRNNLLDAGLYTKPKKSGMSFHIQTNKWPVFICFFNESSSGASLWLRADSMLSTYDFNSAVKHIRASLPERSSARQTPVWFKIVFPPTEMNAELVASLILEHIVRPLLLVMNGENT